MFFVAEARFYLNIDRCAYGGLVHSTIYDHISHILGPNVFAINSTCNGVLYHGDKDWVYFEEADGFDCVPKYT